MVLPIVVRPPEAQRAGIDNLEDVLVWSGAINTTVPITQISDGVSATWEDPVIKEKKSDAHHYCVLQAADRDG